MDNNRLFDLYLNVDDIYKNYHNNHNNYNNHDNVHDGLFLFNVGDVKIYLDFDSSNVVDSDDEEVLLALVLFLMLILLLARAGFSISLLLIFSLSRYRTDFPNASLSIFN